VRSIGLRVLKNRLSESVAVAMTAGHLLAGPEAHAEVGPPSPDSAQSLQERFERRGIRLGIRYDGELFEDLSGGLRRGAAYLGNANCQLTLDAQRLFGGPSLTLFLYGLGIHGGHPSRYVGDAQGVSNIDGPTKWTLEEAWLQQTLFGGKVSALVGRYDLNSEFYRLQSASLFLNSSFGVGPEFSQSGQQGPSIFPDTSVGARIAVKPVRELVLRTVVLDGVPVDRPDGTHRVFAKGDGVLVVAEAAYLHRLLGDEKPRTQPFRIGRNCCGTYTAKLAVGGWYYSATFDDLTRVAPDGQPLRDHGSRGFYLLTDTTVYRDGDGQGRQVALFGELGIGDARVDRFAYYTGGGVTLAGFIPGRGQDEFGMALAAAHNGDEFIQAERNRGVRLQRSEISLELTYLAQFGPHVAVQPDLQFVMHPNTDARIRNSVAFILRFEFAL
jgi:porin